MKQLRTVDWAIIGGYAFAVLEACANAAFPALFDSVAGAFGVPPGLGHKIFMVAGGLVGLAALITGRVQSANTHAQSSQALVQANAPASAITSDVKVVPSDTTVVTQDTPEVPLNAPLPTSS